MDRYHLDLGGDSHLDATVTAMARLGLMADSSTGDMASVIRQRCHAWLEWTLDRFPSEPRRWPVFIFSSEGWQVSILPVCSGNPTPRFRAHVSINPPALLRALDTAGLP
jgi:hypothetical protein